MRNRVENINAYLLATDDVYVKPSNEVLSPSLSRMTLGCVLADGGNLVLSESQKEEAISHDHRAEKFIRLLLSSYDVLHNVNRYCLWITDEEKDMALSIPFIKDRVEAVKQFRLFSRKEQTQNKASTSWKFAEIRQCLGDKAIVIPRNLSQNYQYLPASVGIGIMSCQCYAIYNHQIWNIAIITSRIHAVWIKNVGGQTKNDYRYSNAQGGNTFPAPLLCKYHKEHLTKSAQRILDTRAKYEGKSLYYLYSQNTMPYDLKEAHEENDKIVLGKECKSDDERLALLLEKYKSLTSSATSHSPTLQPLF